MPNFSLCHLPHIAGPPHSKLEAFQWRQAGRNLLRNVILQIAAQNLPLAFEFLFNQARSVGRMSLDNSTTHSVHVVHSFIFDR